MARHSGRCPKCGHPLEVETAVDEQVVCPQCQATLALPGKARRADRVDPLLGARLGQYEIVELLGRGGMAAVYRAVQTSLSRPCAIKVLPEALARDASFVARFQREARSAAAIMHPNVIQIYDVGQEGGFQFIAMELVEGESLADVLRRDGPLAPALALAYLKQTAAALAAAHAKGIIHRDIKPSNILVTPGNVVKVADFGLAKRMGADTGVTRTGQIVGTALYLPPEVAEGHPADPRSDLYSLGATFYHLLSGRPPFEGASVAELLLKHTKADLVPLGEAAPGTPPSFCQVIRRLLRRNPDERDQSAEELLDALARVEVRLRAGAPAPAAAPAPEPEPPAAVETQTAPEAAALLPEIGAPPAPEPQAKAGLPEIAAPPEPAVPPTPRRRIERRAPAPAAHAAGTHVHHTREERLAAHRKQQRTTAILVIVGGTLGVAAIAGLVLLSTLAGGGRADRKRPPEPEPANGEKAPAQAFNILEYNVERLFLDSQRAVSNEAWLSAESYLRRIRTEYDKTKFYERNRVAIDALWAKVQSQLAPKAPPPAP